MAMRWEAQGAAGGDLFDDGYDCDGVTKIQVGPGAEGIHYIEIEYIKNGMPVTVHHGAEGRGIPSEVFEMNHPEEYLSCVEFWYDLDGAIHGVRFKSNKKTSDLIGYHEGLWFAHTVREDEKIISFHGYAGDEYIHSLGVYSIQFSPEDTKKEVE